jgi:hypothetical protein
MNNSLRITKAGLVAERSNAELMVAIKSNMNIDEDLKDLAGHAGKLDTKIAAEADAEKKQALELKL